MKRGYLLPKLCDRRGEVSGIQWYPERFVLPESVFHTGGRVPLLVAVCPWQHALERLEQVVESPGQDHDVVHIQKGHNHYGSITNSWKEGERQEKRADVTAAASPGAGAIPTVLQACTLPYPTADGNSAQPHISTDLPPSLALRAEFLAMVCWHWGEDWRNLPNLTLTQLFQVFVEVSQGFVCLLHHLTS